MTEILQLISSLREQATATLLRSDALRALVWPLSFLATSILILVFAKAPEWLLVGASCIFVIFLLFYCSCYLFLLINDRDSLRSEKYYLQKLAIQHKIIGDNITGVIEQEESSKLLDLDVSEKRLEEGK